MADNYTVQIDLEIIDAEETKMILEKFTGTDGKDGKSAYQYAVEHGYTGTEEEFAEYMANAAEYSEHIQETVDDAIQDALDSGDFTPNITIGTVTDLPAGSTPTANMSGTPQNPVLNLGLVHGRSGNETIDDTAGFGDDDLVWSADKTLKEVDSKADVICKAIDIPSAIVTFEDGADDLPVKEMRIAIEPVQEGTGTPSPDNVRPITGWTGCNVTRTGKNLVVENTIALGYVINETTGNPKVNGDHKITDFIKVVPGNTYTLSGTDLHQRQEGQTSAAGIKIGQYDENYVCVRTGAPDTTSDTKTITVSNRTAYVRVQVGYGASNIQFEEGSVATAFEPYGTTCSITFPGIVYGGELTIHADGTGELVVDRANVEMASLEWNTDSRTSTYDIFRIRANAINALGRNDPISNVFSGLVENPWRMKQVPTGNKNIYISVPTLPTFDRTALQTLLSDLNAQMVFELATPISYQLSAPQVRTLLGLNNIWADAGNIKSITYPVDSKSAMAEVDSRVTTTQGIIAGTDSPVVTENHAIGDVFICDNKLYKAIDAISVGESIIEGSNVIQTSVAELIVKGPRFVCNFGLSKNEYVELQMTGVARAVAFVSGASAGRNGTIHAFSNGSSVYAESATSFNNVSVSYNNTNRTVKIQNTGNDDIYVDVLKLYGDIIGTWVMPLGI